MFLSENKNQPKLPEFVLITSNVRPSVGQFEKSRFLLRLDFRCFLGSSPRIELADLATER